MKKKETTKILRSGIAVFFLLVVFVMAFPKESQAAPKLNKKSITLIKGKSYTLKVKGAKKKAKWNISKKSVVRLSNKKKASVKITAVKAGQAVVSAKVGKKVYKCKVTIVDPKLNKSKLSMTVGENDTLKVTNGTGKVVWKSSDTRVATVANGFVTAKGTGSTTITAVKNGKKLTCVVQVKAKGNAGEADKDESGQSVKKVWVITAPAYTECIAIYDEVHYIECLTCGAIFEGVDAQEIVEPWAVHAEEHMDNGEEARSSVKTRRTLIREEQIDHPEEGYWQEIYE